VNDQLCVLAFVGESKTATEGAVRNVSSSTIDNARSTPPSQGNKVVKKNESSKPSHPGKESQHQNQRLEWAPGMCRLDLNDRLAFVSVKPNESVSPLPERKASRSL
jgi:hypothetical protein